MQKFSENKINSIKSYNWKSLKNLDLIVFITVGTFCRYFHVIFSYKCIDFIFIHALQYK